MRVCESILFDGYVWQIFDLMYALVKAFYLICAFVKAFYLMCVFVKVFHLTCEFLKVFRWMCEFVKVFFIVCVRLLKNFIGSGCLSNILFDVCVCEYTSFGVRVRL